MVLSATVGNHDDYVLRGVFGCVFVLFGQGRANQQISDEQQGCYNCVFIHISTFQEHYTFFTGNLTEGSLSLGGELSFLCVFRGFSYNFERQGVYGVGNELLSGQH